MKLFLERSKNRSLRNCLFGIVIGFYFILETSCLGQTSPMQITKVPVFTEMDTFETTLGNKVITRFDYYLISDIKNNQKEIKIILDSVSRNIFENNDKPEYDDYLLRYYIKDADLNEETISHTEMKFRYKIFVRLRETNFVACYNYRNSELFAIDWGVDFQK